MKKLVILTVIAMAAIGCCKKADGKCCKEEGKCCKDAAAEVVEVVEVAE